ncbi:MAG: uncharacterized protein K0R61_36 [Microvirga sp.]|jgi:hypothetical protein|nr:uncharacterized protein [Microvirga sp.]MDF2969586.1 uncharacterized protein [Microvirga sp.]
MTEEEAKTKWCPFARSQTEDREAAPAVNRTLQGHIDIGCHCIGSRCMAWRDATFTESIYTEPSSSDTGVRHEKRPGGFCGLAGKP